MNIYLVTRKDDHFTYDVFISFVCVAKDEEEARSLIPVLKGHPYRFKWIDGKLHKRWDGPEGEVHEDAGFEPCEYGESWCYNIDDVQAKKIGVADDCYKKAEIIHDYFNAG